MLGRLDRHLEAEGRSRADVRIVVGAVDDRISPELLGEYAEAGVDEVLIPFLRQGTKHLEANLDGLAPFVEAAASLG